MWANFNYDAQDCPRQGERQWTWDGIFSTNCPTNTSCEWVDNRKGLFFSPLFLANAKAGKRYSGLRLPISMVTVSGAIIASTVTGGSVTLSQGWILCLSQAVVNWEELVTRLLIGWVLSHILSFLHPLIILQAFNSTKGERKFGPRDSAYYIGNSVPVLWIHPFPVPSSISLTCFQLLIILKSLEIAAGRGCFVSGKLKSQWQK